MSSIGTITTIQRIAMSTALLAATALTLGAAAMPVDAACGTAQCSRHVKMLPTPHPVLDSRNLIGAPVEAYLHFDDGVLDGSLRPQQLQFGPAFA